SPAGARRYRRGGGAGCPEATAMTEADWLTSTDPRAMLEFLRTRGGASHRKLRLFACACYRLMGHLMQEERNRGGVETTEQFADGSVRKKVLRNARRASRLPWLSSYAA